MGQSGIIMRKSGREIGFTHQPGLHSFSSLKYQRKNRIRTSGHCSVPVHTSHFTPPLLFPPFSSHPRNQQCSTLGFIPGWDMR
jgi:hypothetical protein